MRRASSSGIGMFFGLKGSIAGGMIDTLPIFKPGGTN